MIQFVLLMRKSKSYLEQEEYHSAIESLTSAIELRPDCAAAYYLRGEAFKQLELYPEALANLDKAIALEAKEINYYNLRSEVKTQLQDYTGVIDDCDRAINLGCQEIGTYFTRGYAHNQLNQPQKAIQDYTASIRLAPQFLPAYVNRGHTFVALGKPEKAIADWQQAIKILRQQGDPNASAIEAKLLILIEAESAKARDIASEDNSNSWVGGIGKRLGNLFTNNLATAQEYFDLALEAFEQKDYPLAISYLDKLIKLDLSMAEAHLYRGHCYTNLNRRDLALTDYDRAIKIDPKLANAYYNRGQVYHFQEQYQKAIADYSQTIALEPKNYQAYTSRGTSYHRLKQYRKAIANFNSALKIEPHDFIIYFQRANTYCEMGEYKRAIADYTQAAEENPDYPVIYLSRGYAYEDLGEVVAADGDYKRAIILFDLQNNESGVKQALEAAINLQAKSHLNTNSDRDLTLIYRPKFADRETIENPIFADLERVVEELWQEAQSIIRGEVNTRFTGHFVLEDNQTQDYIQGMWDERFYPAGGFHLEWSCNGNRSWLPLPQSDSETKQVLRLWVEDVRACSALNWELIGDRDPVSLGHPSRRGLKIVRLLKQYDAGERNFRKEDLNNANLVEADLRGINLAQASLVGADLRGANLTRANLTEADLRDSCLIEADLRSANLTGANLEGAIYDEDTEFPAGFDPEAAEMEFYDYEEDEDEEAILNVDKHYLDTEEEILGLITHLSALETLWLDTEIADWNTPHPRLSLIQVLADPQDTTGASTYILDVLDKPEIVTAFIDRLMINPDIEKVFHNASFDLRYLGKDKAQNVTCTLKIARKIGKSALGTTNLKLKTLAVELCNFPPAEIAKEQASDWGKRPLNEAQIKYAKMDVVYLAQLHHYLLEFSQPDMPAPPNKSFSVTDVRVAVECPRLFYLSKNFGGKTLFIPQSGVAGIGKTFHKLAEDLITTIKQEHQFQALFKPSANRLEVDTIAPQMRDLFYNLVFFPNYLQPTIQTKPELAPALNQIWQAISNLIHKWTELLIKNRVHCNIDRLFDNTFVATELKLQHGFALPDSTNRAIAGRLDCLIYDYSKNSLCVVELKTYAPVDSAAQLAQVALYSYMVHQAKQVSVNSVVYCVLPEFKEYFYLWSELETNLHRVIPHKLQQMQQWLQWQPPQPDAPPATSNLELCDICPQAEKCQSYFPAISQGDKTATEKPKPVVKPPQPPLDPEPIGRELVDILKSFKVNVEYMGAIAGTTFIRIKLKPGRGVKVASILKLAADLQVQLGLTRPPLIATQAGYVSVDLPREDRQTAYFKNYIQPQQTPDSAPITIAIGVDLEGKLVETDLANPNNCHFLVGGTPGSGKSEFLRSLLLSLIYRYSPKQVKVALVDPKRVTFPEFTKMPWLLSPVVKDSEAAISLMEELVAEMDKRYQLLETAGCPHLDAYNQKKALDKQLPRIVCIFDEYADFMVEKETRNALETSIKRLGGMARASGIHLIIATQRPEAGVVTPIIRSNLPGRIALSTSGSEGNSKIILGGNQTEAAYLLGKGDLLYQVGARLQRLQSLFTDAVRLPD